LSLARGDCDSAQPAALDLAGYDMAYGCGAALASGRNGISFWTEIFSHRQDLMAAINKFGNWASTIKVVRSSKLTGDLTPRRNV
jgi:hypothetical protein